MCVKAHLYLYINRTMDEIKSIISELPPQDISILKAIYNPEMAKSELSQEWSRLIPIIDGLSTDEQQQVVDVETAPLGAPEAGDVNVDISSTEMSAMPIDMPEEVPMEEDEDEKNKAGNFEDFLI